MKFCSKLIFAGVMILLTACGEPLQGGSWQTVTSKPLSLNQHNFRTCVFDPVYSIVHFPMLHYPPEGHYSQETRERTIRSQFQLFHTLLAYNRSSRELVLFDEHFTTDVYNKSFYQELLNGSPQIRDTTYTRLDGQVFFTLERFRTAHSLFQGFPQYYEHLNEIQKDFLFHTGASFTLYLLGEIPKIHKVISLEQFRRAKSHLQDISGRLSLQQNNNYWIYTFREEMLKIEVLNIFRQPSPQLIFIAYGLNHDLSNEFAGYPFQSGHDICLDWMLPSAISPPILP